MYDDKALREAVASCNSWFQVSRHLGIAYSSQVRGRLIERAMSLGLDFSTYKGRSSAAHPYSRMSARTAAAVVSLDIKRIEDGLTLLRSRCDIPPEVIRHVRAASFSIKTWQKDIS